MAALDPVQVPVHLHRDPRVAARQALQVLRVEADQGQLRAVMGRRQTVGATDTLLPGGQRGDLWRFEQTAQLHAVDDRLLGGVGQGVEGRLEEALKLLDGIA